MWKSIPNNQTQWPNTNRGDDLKLSAGVKGVVALWRCGGNNPTNECAKKRHAGHHFQRLMNIKTQAVTIKAECTGMALCLACNRISAVARRFSMRFERGVTFEKEPLYVQTYFGLSGWQ